MKKLHFVETKFRPSHIDPCEVQSNNARYIRTYLICIRLEKMARPLASDVSCWRAPKNLFYFSVVVPVRWIPSALGRRWSECVLRICQHPRYTLFRENCWQHSPPRARHDFHPPANKKSHVHVSPTRIRRQNRRCQIIAYENNMIVNLKYFLSSDAESSLCRKITQ